MLDIKSGYYLSPCGNHLIEIVDHTGWMYVLRHGEKEKFFFYETNSDNKQWLNIILSGWELLK